MTQLPTTTSHVPEADDHATLAREVLANWSLSPANIELITDDTNAVYDIDTGADGRYALRLGHARVCHDDDELIAELAWLDALREETDIMVPRAVPTQDGAAYCKIEGNGRWRHAALFEWLRGETIGDDLGEDDAYAIGELIAKLHEHARQFTLPAGARVRCGDRVLPWSANGFDSREPVMLFEDRHRSLYEKGMRDVYERAYAHADQAISTLFASGVKPRLIHNDLHPWNLRRDGDRIAVFDFEDLVMGYPAQDIATFAYYLRIHEDGDAMATPFREGYESVRAWPIESPKRFNGLVMARGIILANFLLAGIDDHSEEKVRDWLNRIGGRLEEWCERS